MFVQGLNLIGWSGLNCWNFMDILHNPYKLFKFFEYFLYVYINIIYF